MHCARAATRAACRSEQFILGYRKTALQPGELIEAIRIPHLPTASSSSVYKVSKRFDQDISTVIGAFRIELRDGNVHELRAAYGGMARAAKRAQPTWKRH